ncbi:MULTISPECIES: restriction endonuclease subunit S [Staphylococcus]|uniref:Restriction endonuclease subunit S n=2 Tax=Staphylococcus schleiferi TaxID=1295 RepID=A0ABX0FWN2_STASC|nr:MULTISPECIES: restriction endonuclease subunit S [Staphylococcus]QGS46485.1 restriction endonuclease subunit S [Mammaliicoccus fleurettii]EPD50093.1 hypothetical protein HMPREF1208_01631 [Staphylococcus sp. HGB0015]MBF1992072.1 restriction endonuclease subunit S [Staphylococcus schleiferi]MBF2037522.1 restriction endonuclease subunit S [Staphylococcus schleiferi]MBF2099534.1 restriction endonuclease subunit S [Staphylococcus schleiferi]
MTNETKNVPELRFPEFDGEWEKKVLGEISNRVKRKNTNSVSKMPLTISGALGLVDQVTYFSKSVSAKNLDNYTLIKNGEFAYNKSYSNGYPLGAIKRLERYDQGALSTLYICFKFNDNQSSEFMKHYFESDKWYKEVSQIAVEGARNHGLLNIPVNDFFSINLFTPMLLEQQKIGEFFSKLDHQIELEEKKLALLEEQKKGYVQKIFSQELRFKDENGNNYPEWNEQKLEELGTFNSGVGFPEKYQGGNLGIPFFKVSDMNLPTNKTLMNMANNYVTDQQINEKKWKVINDVPAVIFAKVGAAIMLNRKRMVIEPFLMDNNTMSYSFSTHWDTNFGNIFFQTLNLPKYAQVGALPSYNSKDIGIIAVNLPSLSEQKKIGSFFIKLDSFIEKQSAKVKRLKVRKKGFLQKMFV